jgi:phosphatidylserine decarboxylase
MTAKFVWNDPPGQTAFPIAKAGYPYIFAAAFVTAVFALLGLTAPAMAGLAAAFCICMFFRDPDRVVPAAEGAIVAPADGKVVLVEKETDCPYLEGRWAKVSIFMSVFNVHVNRVPFEGAVEKTVYCPGKFFNASFDKASKFNERNAVVVETADGKQVCFVQIAGLIARRIVCAVQEGDEVKRGQRMGMICFGSRVDVYVSPECRLAVGKGDRTFGGSTILGYMPDGPR